MNEIVPQTLTLAEIQRKARYGHRSYLYWTDRTGALQWAPYNQAGIKRAILDVGCNGRFYWFDDAGCSHIARRFGYMIHLWRCARQHYG